MNTNYIKEMGKLKNIMYDNDKLKFEGEYLNGVRGKGQKYDYDNENCNIF